MNVAAIEPLSLPSLPLSDKAQLPNCAAIYFVLDGDRILSISTMGNTSSAVPILAQPEGQALLANSFSWYECSDRKLGG